MKNNYLNRELKNGLKALAFLCVFGYTNANAQTIVTKTGNIRTITTTTYPAGPVTITSTSVSLEGTTFQIQATLTPNSTANGALAVITSNASNRYGVDGVTIDGNLGESIAISDVKIVNFDQGTTAYTEAAISDLSLTGLTLFNSGNTDDNVKFTIVGGTNAGDFTIGRTAATTISFGVEYTNGAGALFTVGTTTGVTGFTLTNGSILSTDSFQWIGTNWSLNFTKDDSLGVNDYNATTNSGLIVSPNPVVDVLSLNMPIQSAEIIDVTGKTVKSFNGETSSLDLSSIVPGTYILKAVNQEGKAFTKKILK